MSKTRQQKEAALSVLEADLDHKGVVFFSYAGLKVVELEELRKKLRAEASTVIVAKRNLLLLATKHKGYSDLDADLPGAIAVAVGDDEVAPAKIVAEFGKAHESVQLFGGILEHAFVNATAVKQLATLPSKQQLLGQVVGCLNAPISGFVNVCAGTMRGLLNVLQARQEQQAKS